jgi:hypothetical protein
MICLEICAEFQYWLKRKTCKTSPRVTLWYTTSRPVGLMIGPGGTGSSSFRRGGRQRNIKHSQAKVTRRSCVPYFFCEAGKQSAGHSAIPHISYKETWISNDLGLADAFFGRGSKYYKQVINHSCVLHQVARNLVSCVQLCQLSFNLVI